MSYQFPDPVAMPRVYELALILTPDPKRKESVEERIDGVLSTAKGKIHEKHDWGSRRLAYPVQREDEGHYLFYQVSLVPSSVPGLEKSLAEDEEVLRFVIFLNDTFVIPSDEGPPTPRQDAGPRPSPVVTPKSEEGGEDTPERVEGEPESTGSGEDDSEPEPKNGDSPEGPEETTPNTESLDEDTEPSPEEPEEEKEA
ncbi:30S ribosomal protein S6 [bacterium]|nr:30S ribosomal protein S6 [bacterium]